MHRSGTSAVTRVLASLGCDLPNTLMEADSNNAMGYWESTEIADLNDAILASAGSSWDDCEAFNPDWYASLIADNFRERARAVLTSEFGDSRLFVLKDPRICRLLQFWTEALDGIGAVSVVALPVRNPLEVAASLQVRDAIDPSIGVLIWLRNVLDAEASSRGLRRAFTRYQDVLDNWKSLASRLGSELEVAWPKRSTITDLEIESFIASSIRHHAQDDARVHHDPSISRWVKTAFEILDRWACGNVRKTDAAKLDSIRMAFDDSGQNFSRPIAIGRRATQTNRAYEAQIDSLDRTGRERIAEVESLEQAIGERDRQIADLDKAVRERDQRVADRDSRIDSLDRTGRERIAEVESLEQAMGERDRQIADLDKAVRERDQRVADRDSRIDSLDRIGRERIAEVESLEQAMGERDRQIADLDKAVRERDQRVADRDSQLTSVSQLLSHRDQQVADRDSRIDSLDRTGRERIAEVESLEQAMGERDRQIADLDRAVGERIAEIESLEQARGERDRQIADLDEAVRERDQRIVDLDESLQRTIAERDARTSQIEAIHGSTSWRIIQPLRFLKIVVSRSLRGVRHLGRRTPSTRRYVASGRLQLADRNFDAANNQGDTPILFDPEYYVATNEEVRNNESDPLQHYLEQGAVEGLLPFALEPGEIDPEVETLHRIDTSHDDAFAFDAQFYRDLNPDLAHSDDKALFDHYSKYGRAESRAGSRGEFARQICDDPREIPLDFNAAEYIDLYPDLNDYAERSPLETLRHYMCHGRWEPRLHTHRGDATTASGDPTSINMPTELMPETRPLCVLAHIYYPDLWEELAGYLANLPEDTYDLYVNLVDTTFTQEFEQRIRDAFPAARIYIGKNIGRDIGGHFQLLRNVSMEDYRFFCLIHSKKSPHLSTGDALLWRRRLLTPLLGTRELAIENLKLMLTDDTIGLIGSRRCRDTELKDNAEKFIRFLDLLNVGPESRDVEFLSGTMMYLRREVLQRIFESCKDLPFEKGDDTPLQFHLDAQWAHAIERGIGNVVRDMNYRFEWR